VKGSQTGVLNSGVKKKGGPWGDALTAGKANRGDGHQRRKDRRIGSQTGWGFIMIAPTWMVKGDALER